MRLYIKSRLFLNGNLLLLLVYICVYLFNLQFNTNTNHTKYFLFITYIFIVISSIKHFSYFHSLNLFLYAFGLFLMGRIFLDIFLGIPSEFADKWNNYWLSSYTIKEVNNSLTLALIGTGIGASFYKKIKLKKDKNKSIIRPLKIIIYILIPFCLAKLWLDYAQVRDGGYITLYTGLKRSPFYLRASWYLLVTIFPLLLTDINNKKQFKYLVLLFIIIDGLNILQGARGALFRPLAFFIWYYYKFISIKKVKLIKLAYFSIIIIFSSVLLLQLREKDTKVDNVLFYVMQSLSGSYYTHAYFIDYSNNFVNPSNFYILAPVVDYVKYLYDPDLKGHTLKRVEKTLSLDHKLTYEMATTSYLSGHGLGGSYITEMYALGGKMGVFLISILLGYSIIYLENLFVIAETTRYIAWFWIGNLVWMPRAGLLDFIPSVIICYVFYKFLYRFQNSYD
ncbi:hypothetical protein BST83_12165 [Polaribacter filamentus]|uniref:O-antigen polysaccharide polymerase Wzy n=1 Tax=Polaribacter filamentus TaxID=53483 RepID=A0A2S7KZ92_9FLAO|nr:O-antigen polysaccharide polymerase Wzy [Polaribacter filamentus]PQB07823.1 hypothetical protein BST83_12165 [Polaribacter filamentus]